MSQDMGQAVEALTRAVDSVASRFQDGMTREERETVGKEVDRLFTMWMRVHLRWGVAA